MNFLLLEDEPRILRTLAEELSPYANVFKASDLSSSFEILENNKIDAVLSDLNLDKDRPETQEGFKLLEKAKLKDIRTVAITSFNDSDTTKQLNDIDGTLHVDKKVLLRNGEKSIRYLCNMLRGDILVNNFLMNEYKTNCPDLIRQIKSLPKQVTGELSQRFLVLGETGVGKTPIVKFIHSLTGANKEDFVHANLNDFSPNLVESELFGHVKGAFTGAEKSKNGILKHSDGKTLFLDEIGLLSKEIQTKLLLPLQEGFFSQMGSNSKNTWNSRLIGATSTPYDVLVKDVLIKDFFFRLSGPIIEIPPLRERRCDIKMLLEFYLEEYGELLKVEIEDKAIQKLVSYDWPGNIRELQNTVRMICASGYSYYKAEYLPKHIWDNKSIDSKDDGKSLLTKQVFNKIKKMGLDNYLKELEDTVILEALKQEGGHKTNVGKVLGITRQRVGRFADKLEK